MSATGGDSSAQRLERALGLYLEHARLGTGDAETLLQAHEDLREFLEPMLAPRRAPSGADAAEQAERRLGDFRLVRELGRGGMGIVYEAWQRSLDRRVALKVLAPALVASPASVARFRREASLVARLEHPGIVKVHGFGGDDDRHWFAMELVDGQPLQACRAAFRAPALAIELLAQVVDALQHAHAAGLVHRDVKPGNILVRNDGRAVLTDFGLASDSAQPTVTAEGSFLGTLEYSSPEQVQGERVDARADVWSAGVVLYELLTGVRPFARKSATAVMHAVLTTDVADVRTHDPALGADLAAVLGKALARDPARRYASAAALLADLRALQCGGTVSARSTRAAERLARWARREPWRAATCAVLLVALPAMAVSLGYLWANAPRIRAAAARESALAREDRLTAAWLAVAENVPERLQQGLATLGEPGTDPELLVTRAALLLGLHRGDEARRLLQPCAGEPPVDRMLSLLRAEVAEVPRAPAAAATAFECFTLGQIAYTQGREQDDADLCGRAAAFCARAVALSPAPRAAFLLWWMITAARAEDDIAYATAEAAYEQHFPDSDGLLRARAFTAAHQPPERGITMFRAALAAERAPDLSLRFALALCLRRAGRNDEALREFAAALGAEPTNAPGWVQLGLCKRDLHDMAGAIAALQQAVLLEPGDAKALDNLGLCQREAGQKDDALRSFTAAVAADPSNWRAELNLGSLCAELGRSDEARVHLERSLQLHPDDARSRANLAALQRQQGHWQEALATSVLATAAAPQDAQLHVQVARVAAQLRLAELAGAAADRAIALAPTSVPVWRAVAEVFLMPPVVDGARALASARRAVDLTATDDPFLRVLLARAMGASGDRAGAQSALESLRTAAAAGADQRLVRAIDAALAELARGK